MSANHHYVSKFHLSQFLDPASTASPNPWLWQGRIPDGPVGRRAPKNVGTARLLFDGPGGLRNRSATLETFLAQKVEGPAAEAIKELSNVVSPGDGVEIPGPLWRYLAWAAARALPMVRPFSGWAQVHRPVSVESLVEPPPEGMLSAATDDRHIAMRHNDFGDRTCPPDANFDGLIKDGWFPDPNDRDNFLEMVHIQAYYFQVRFFPRLKWSALYAPEGDFFVIADRAVGWVADGYLDAPPSSLRHPSTIVLAPLTKSLLLIGRHTTNRWQVTQSHV